MLRLVQFAGHLLLTGKRSKAIYIVIVFYVRVLRNTHSKIIIHKSRTVQWNIFLETYNFYNGDSSIRCNTNFNGLFSVIYDNDTTPFVLINLILSSLICPKRCVFKYSAFTNSYENLTQCLVKWNLILLKQPVILKVRRKWFLQDIALSCRRSNTAMESTSAQAM